MLLSSRFILLSTWLSACLWISACGTDPSHPATFVQPTTNLTYATTRAAALPSRLQSNANQSYDLYSAATTTQVAGFWGATASPPNLASDLNILVNPNDPNFTNKTSKLAGAARTLVPHLLNANATLRLPRQGNEVFAINVDGNRRQANTLASQFWFDPNDLDPLDARLRVRVVAVPVLAPGNANNHTAKTQAFVFVDLTNASRGNLNLASFHRYAGQPSIPWLSNGNSLYTAWQLIEFTPSIRNAAVGDQAALSMTAAGCSPGAHVGTLYVDQVGNYSAGGTTLVAYGPEFVGSTKQINYPFRLRQTGGQDANNAQVTIALPAGTEFVAFSPPRDWTCTLPAVGGTGTVACSVSTLPSGYAGLANLVVTVPAGAPSPVVLANYGVTTTTQLNLLGPAVSTGVVTDANVQLGDLTAEVHEDLSLATATTSTLVATVHNAGPATATGAYIVDAVGPHLTVQHWNCAGQAGAQLAGSSSAQGTGNLTTSYNLVAGANVVCDIVVVRDGSGLTSTYGVAAQAPAAITDPTSYNSEAASFVQGTYAGAGTAASGNNIVTSNTTTPSVCTSAQDCNGRACTDGYCCDQSCEQACMACNVSGQEGTCSPLPSHASPLLGHGSCGPYLCGTGNCLTACLADSDCTATLTCQASVCRPVTGACRTDADCAAGLRCTPAKTCESLAMQDPNHPNWTLEGSGCAAGPGGGGAGAGAGLVALWGLWLGRRGSRRASLGRGARLLAVLGLLAAGSLAQAADSSSLPTNPYLPLGGLNDIFATAAAPKSPLGSFYLGGQINYANAPLRLRHTVPPAARQNIVAHQGTLDLMGGVALPYNTEVDLAVPLVLQQDRQASFASAHLNRQQLQLSLGDLRLTPKWTLLRGTQAHLALAAVVGLPSGRRNAYVGRGSLNVTPLIIAEFGKLQGLRILLNVGVTLQNHRTFAGINSHHSLRWSAAGELPWLLGKRTLAIKATALGQMDLAHPRKISSPIEALLGLGLGVGHNLRVDVGGGAGLSRGYGAPRWRVMASLGWQPPRHEPEGVVPVPATLPVAETEPPAEAPTDVGALDPNGDEDHDGVLNADDVCPTVAGDPNGPSPGCPTLETAGPLLAKLHLVYFGSNEASVVAADTAALEQVRQVMAALPEARLVVEGHTDDVGEARHNQRLSLARALAARSWLVAHGVHEDRVDAVGRGGSRPVDRRHTAAARAKNRRVVFKLLLAKTSDDATRQTTAPSQDLAPTQVPAYTPDPQPLADPEADAGER